LDGRGEEDRVDETCLYTERRPLKRENGGSVDFALWTFTTLATLDAEREKRAAALQRTVATGTVTYVGVPSRKTSLLVEEQRVTGSARD
jgi:hypothetical protein